MTLVLKLTDKNVLNLYENPYQFQNCCEKKLSLIINKQFNIVAVDLAKEQKLNYGDDVTSVLRQARKKRFQLKEEQRVAQDIELQSYLNQLIIKDAERNLENLKDRESQDTENETDSNATGATREQIEEHRDNCLAGLNDLFTKVDERRRVSIPATRSIFYTTFQFLENFNFIYSI